MTIDDIKDKSPEELQRLHRSRREQLAKLRTELDLIETVLHPQLVKNNAIRKLKQAGLTPAELASLQNPSEATNAAGKPKPAV